MRFCEHFYHDNENSDSDNEEDVEDFEVTKLETSMTRSGRQVKHRVIQGMSHNYESE